MSLPIDYGADYNDTPSSWAQDDDITDEVPDGCLILFAALAVTAAVILGTIGWAVYRYCC